MRITTLVTILLMLNTQGISASEPVEKTTSAEILLAAENFLADFRTKQQRQGRKVRYEAGTVDSRVSLADCPSALAVSFNNSPMDSTRPTLEVSCQGERPWRMYVTAAVEIIGDAVVAARPLGRGDRISADMLELKPVILNERRRDTITSIDHIEGMEARRAISRGVPITADLIIAPPAVNRGDHVIIHASAGGFSVASRGKALGAAAIGEQVLVENLSSSRTLRARVTAPGRVDVAM